MISGRIKIDLRCEGYYLRWYYNGWHYWQFHGADIEHKTEGENYRIHLSRIYSLNSGVVNQQQITGLKTILNSREVYILSVYGWQQIRLERTPVTVKKLYKDGFDMTIKVVIGALLSPTGYSPISIPPVVPPGEPAITWLDCIGTQLWSAFNYASNYPGSKVYDDNEANRAIYGGLYNYNQVVSNGFCPDGTHVPTLAEWVQLIEYRGGEELAGMLKETGTAHWIAPNTGADGLYDFNALPGGIHNRIYGYISQGQNGVFLTSTKQSPTSNYAYGIQFNYNAGSVSIVLLDLDTYCSVRLVNDTHCVDPYEGYGALYNWYAASKVANDKVYFASRERIVYEYDRLTAVLTPAFGGGILSNIIGVDEEYLYTYWDSVFRKYDSSGTLIHESTRTEAGTINGLCIKDGKVITVVGSDVVSYDISGATAVMSTLFTMPQKDGYDRFMTGDIMYNYVTDKFIIANHTEIGYFITEFTSSGSIVQDIDITDLCTSLNSYCFGLFYTGQTLSFILNGIDITYVYDLDGETPVINVTMDERNIWDCAQYAPQSSAIAPEGWHVPTLAEFYILTNELGGELVAGGHLKETGTVHWLEQSAGCDNSSGFNAIGSGIRNADGSFDGTHANANYAFNDITISWSLYFNTDEALIYTTTGYGTEGASIRLIKDNSTDPGTVTDIDGNIYPTVKIGDQVWMASNLKVTKYNDGTTIPVVIDNAEWAGLTEAAMCFYNNTPD